MAYVGRPEICLPCQATRRSDRIQRSGPTVRSQEQNNISVAVRAKSPEVCTCRIPTLPRFELDHHCRKESNGWNVVVPRVKYILKESRMPGLSTHPYYCTGRRAYPQRISSNPFCFDP
ncbi:hypothetical protein N7510_010656 [Penicillium lagena]|uniref:uncharacterized protein n=1 Tax=Penicillium lagena TaxID=94218 RepID=UPI0025420605|nr:uncharacterized protein N7510_010656 [Penicillium lagena]KAJ5601122.1 hypothetical protein N7510_010656 [Penicillium lagena]